MTEKLKLTAAVLVLVAIAGSVLLLFDTAGERWPDMELPSLTANGVVLQTTSFASKPAVINFWASWCVACRTEHAVLQKLSREDGVPVFGVNHLDNRDDALRWLDYYGNPYDNSVYDADGRIGRKLDIEALPVSLVVDAVGVIHYRHLGPLDSATVETTILPLVEELRRK